MCSRGECGNEIAGWRLWEFFLLLWGVVGDVDVAGGVWINRGDNWGSVCLTMQGTCLLRFNRVA